MSTYKIVAIAALVAISVGAFSYVIAYFFSANASADARRQSIAARGRSGRSAGIDQAKRRKAVSESLKEIEARRTGKRPGLSQQIAQAGLMVSVTVFRLGVAILSVVLAAVAYSYSKNVYIAGSVGVFAYLGLPRWALTFLRKRRIKKFILGFPEAIDVIIRGIRAGLPVSDCFRLIANEAAEPLGSEFSRIVEAQAIGLSIGEAADILVERVPSPETSFFSIVLNLQEKTGGNLAETLSNLVKVLRDRKKMRDKVKAVSSEAKSSAAIIGSLPFIVAGVVYFVSPSYIMLLFTTTTGYMIVAGSLMWMSIGVFIMRQMINFEI